MNTQYLAGLVDGEGHITKSPLKSGKGKAYMYTRLIVVQSEKNNGEALVAEIKDAFGGNVSYTGYNRMWRWQLQGKKAEALIREMYPHFRVKKAQADMALAA